MSSPLLAAPTTTAETAGPLVLVTIPLLSLLVLLVACSSKKVSTSSPACQNSATGGARYIPGHLPEFADPCRKETNTFYDVNSATAFPPKDENGNPLQASSVPGTANPASNRAVVSTDGRK